MKAASNFLTTIPEDAISVAMGCKPSFHISLPIRGKRAPWEWNCKSSKLGRAGKEPTGTAGGHY